MQQNIKEMVAPSVCAEPGEFKTVQYLQQRTVIIVCNRKRFRRESGFAQNLKQTAPVSDAGIVSDEYYFVVDERIKKGVLISGIPQERKG